MPPKKKAPLTDEEKYQQALQSEADLQRLQRQYILLERDRNLFSQGNKFLKQMRVLSIFKKEQENILTDLAVANASAKKRDDARISDNLNNLLAEYDVYASRVGVQKTYIKEVDQQIKMVQREVQNLQARQITDRQYQDRVWNAMKTVEALDNKLEVQIKKFCTICSENRRMREEIDHLMLERQNFIKFFDKLIYKLTVGKQYMLDLIEQATIAYDQREEWCNKLQALRMKAHHDLLHHTQEMREYKRKQDNNKTLEDFFGVKCQKRLMRDLQMKERIKRMEHNRVLKNTLARYTHMMDDIYEFTNDHTISVIGRKFYQNEAENFSLFNYANDLIEEMEGVSDRLGNLHMDIDEKKFLHEARACRQRERIEELEGELAQELTRTEDLGGELRKVDEELDTMMKGIQQLFKICKCSNDPIVKLLADGGQIKFYNVLLYLEILEKRVQEALLKVYYKEKILVDKRKISPGQRVIPEQKTTPVIYDLSKIVASNPCPLCVEHEMVSDVIDVLQKVVSRSDAEDRLDQRLALPDGLARIHNVSNCHLPKSREIIQRRYQ